MKRVIVAALVALLKAAAMPPKHTRPPDEVSRPPRPKRIKPASARFGSAVTRLQRPILSHWTQPKLLMECRHRPIILLRVDYQPDHPERGEIHWLVPCDHRILKERRHRPVIPLQVDSHRESVLLQHELIKSLLCRHVPSHAPCVVGSTHPFFITTSEHRPARLQHRVRSQVASAHAKNTLHRDHLLQIYFLLFHW